MRATFRFRPRYRGVAWTSIGIGSAVAIASGTVGFLALPLVTGALGIAAGAAYLASPAWRLVITVDDDGLAVGTRRKQRFRVAWSDVVRVVAAPDNHTCFVDGGAPEKSLLVPGQGAPAPYDIEDRAGLVDAILAHVPADKVERVASLQDAVKQP